MSSAAGPRAALWILRALVACLPRGLRETYGESILATFEDAWLERRRERGRTSALVFALRAVVDLLASVVGERRRARSGPSGLGTGLVGDMHQAFRWLRRSPGFAAAAIVVLALSIGVNAAIFTAVRGLLLAKPPYPEPDRLVLFHLVEAGAVLGDVKLWSYAKVKLMSEMEEPGIAPLSVFRTQTFTLGVGTESVRAPTEMVSHTYLPMLGARPFLGRLFTAEEDDPAAPELVAVISHALWGSAFGADPAVIGRSVRIRSHEVRIVGVLQPSFDGITDEIGVWIPVTAAALLYSPEWIQNPSFGLFQVVGRIPSGGTLERARSWADAALLRVEEVHPDGIVARDERALVQTLSEARVRPEARAAVIAMAAAALAVLMIGCVNVAIMLLARGQARAREVAVRVALGAGRGRVMRQLLAESAALALLGGAGGVLVARYAAKLLNAHWPERFSQDPSGWLRALDPDALAIDPSALAFAGALTLATTVLFGVVPALRLSSTGPGEALKSGDRAFGRASRGLDARGALVAAEVALAFVLLVGGTLMTTTMVELLAVERGFESEGLVRVDYNLPSVDGASDEARQLALLERLSSDPRIQSAALGCAGPLAGLCLGRTIPVSAERYPWLGERKNLTLAFDAVSDGYFATLGTRVLAGRTFGPEDGEGASPVAVLNAAARAALFGDGDAIGRTLPFDDAVVVGVVEDILDGRPQEATAPHVYRPIRQDRELSPRLFLRTEMPVEQASALVTEHIHVIERTARVSGITTGHQMLAEVTADTRAVLWLIGVFAVSSLFLAALGIWSVVAYTVGQRRQELGLRMALGARAHSVVGLVARGGLATAGLGLLIGVGAAYASSRLLSSLLFGVAPTDPRVYLIASALFAAAVLFASVIPALGAARVDPVRAMRAE